VGAIALRFQSTSVMWQPDWSEANDTVGGMQAFRTDDSEATGEGHEWAIRTDTSAALAIDATLAAPDLPQLRQTLADLMASVRIAPTVAPSPDASSP